LFSFYLLSGKSVPLLSPLYNASDAPIRINLNPRVHPNDVTNTVLPRNTCWEFIPVDEPELEAPVTKFLHKLEEGRSYEVVLINGAGLYRYRLEDVVNVTGFWHGLP
jgi:auxin responsive GH3 family protein